MCDCIPCKINRIDVKKTPTIRGMQTLQDQKDVKMSPTIRGMHTLQDQKDVTITPTIRGRAGNLTTGTPSGITDVIPWGMAVNSLPFSVWVTIGCAMTIPARWTQVAESQYSRAHAVSRRGRLTHLGQDVSLQMAGSCGQRRLDAAPWLKREGQCDSLLPLAMRFRCAGRQ